MDDVATAPSSTAPATSGAPSGETSRPTMAQAFADHPVESSASPADTPTPQDAQTAQPAAATVPPVSDPAAPITPAPGPIPFERHKSILDGAYKERDTFKSQYESLKQQMDSPDGQRLRQWAQGYAQNPEQWFANTVAELAAANPTLVPALRSKAARLLGSKAAPAETPASFEPDIPVYNDTGQLVAQTFSADKVKAIVTHAVNEALQREVGPIKQDFAQRKQQQEAAAIHADAQKVAASEFEEAKTWDGFLIDRDKGTVDPDLVTAFAEHPEWSLDRCYQKIVVPKLLARKESQTLDALKTKAAAASGVNPAGAVVAATHKPRSLLDKSLTW